jgi:phosphotransferase system enzyme I (PtsI)
VPGAPAELSAFVDLHAMILADPALTDGVRELIRERRCNAEWAMVQQMQLVVDQFDEFEDAYLRERKQTSCRWSSACSRCCRARRASW